MECKSEDSVLFHVYFATKYLRNVPKMKDFALEDFESLSKWVSAYLQSHIQEGSIEKNTGCYSWGI